MSVWSGPHGKAIDYEYGADQKRVRLRAIGPDGSDEGFAVRFPNGLVLDIVPQGTALQVSDRSGNYSKTFEWQYEGPVDGRGTFCTPCVEKADRSEEHTSELQSLMRISYAAFCLKNKKTKQTNTH